eukprot:gene1406-12026_t
MDKKEKIKQNVSKSLLQSISHIKSELDSLESNKKKNLETKELLFSEIEKLVSEYEKKELAKLDEYKNSLEKQHEVLNPDLKASSLQEILEKSQSAKEALVSRGDDDRYKVCYDTEVLNRELKRCLTMSFKTSQKVQKKKDEEYVYSASDLRSQLGPVFKFLDLKQTKNFVTDLFSIRGVIQSGKFQEKLLKYTFSFYDTDKNGYIDENEFGKLLIDMGNSLFPSYIETLSTEIEKNQDLDYFMKRALIQHLKHDIHEEQIELKDNIEEEFESIDRNGDKKVSFEEFTRYFRKFFILGIKRTSSQKGIEYSIKDEFENLDLYDLEHNEAQFLEMDLSEPIKNKICTSSYSRKNYVKQKIYECIDCDTTDMEIGNGLCEVCINICHQGHKTKLLDEGYYYCVCPGEELDDNENCKCFKDIKIEGTEIHPKVQKCIDEGTCTSVYTGEGFFVQKYYNCKDCKMVVCESCSDTCHSGHDCSFGGIGDSYCDCPDEDCGICDELDSDSDSDSDSNSDTDSVTDISSPRSCGSFDSLQIDPIQEVDIVEQAIDDGVCTLTTTGENYTVQKFYICKDCGLGEEGCSICESCINTCHSGHNTEYWATGECYCDCGSGEGTSTCQIYSK